MRCKSNRQRDGQRHFRRSFLVGSICYHGREDSSESSLGPDGRLALRGIRALRTVPSPSFNRYKVRPVSNSRAAVTVRAAPSRLTKDSCRRGRVLVSRAVNGKSNLTELTDVSPPPDTWTTRRKPHGKLSATICPVTDFTGRGLGGSNKPECLRASISMTPGHVVVRPRGQACPEASKQSGSRPGGHRRYAPRR